MFTFTTPDEALGFLQASANRFYVYVLRRPCGEPFYVGKGSGDRVCQHERAVRLGRLDSYRARVIGSILSAGLCVSYEIVCVTNDEADAFAHEIYWIAKHGRFDRREGTLANHTNGGEGASDPSAETIAKRVVGLRAAMSDPAYRAKAVKNLRSREDLRQERASVALRSPENRESARQRMLILWADPTFRASTAAASSAAQTDEWRASLRAGQANRRKLGNDEGRLRALRSPEVQARIKAAATTPEAIERRRASARRQRAEAEAIRSRVLSLYARLGATAPLPNHRSAARTWAALEIAFTASGVL